MEHTHAVLEWLERHGRAILNGSKALALESSKIRQYRALEDMNILIPRTVVVTADPTVQPGTNVLLMRRIPKNMFKPFSIQQQPISRILLFSPNIIAVEEEQE